MRKNASLTLLFLACLLLLSACIYAAVHSNNFTRIIDLILSDKALIGFFVCLVIALVMLGRFIQLFYEKSD